MNQELKLRIEALNKRIEAREKEEDETPNKINIETEETQNEESSEDPKPTSTKETKTPENKAEEQSTSENTEEKSNESSWQTISGNVVVPDVDSGDVKETENKETNEKKDGTPGKFANVTSPTRTSLKGRRKPTRFQRRSSPPRGRRSSPRSFRKRSPLRDRRRRQPRRSRSRSPLSPRSDRRVQGKSPSPPSFLHSSDGIKKKDSINEAKSRRKYTSKSPAPSRRPSSPKRRRPRSPPRRKRYSPPRRPRYRRRSRSRSPRRRVPPRSSGRSSRGGGRLGRNLSKRENSGMDSGGEAFPKSSFVWKETNDFERGRKSGRGRGGYRGRRRGGRVSRPVDPTEMKWDHKKFDEEYGEEIQREKKKKISKEEPTTIKVPKLEN